MRNLLFTILGIIVIASLIFLLGYLVGRGYELREEPVAKSASPAGGKIAKEEVIPKPRVTPETPPLKAGLPYAVQVVSSQSEEKALALVNRLKAKAYSAYIEEVEIKGKKWFRVRVGSFMNRDDAQKLVDKLKEKEGLKEAMVWKRRESGKVRK